MCLLIDGRSGVNKLKDKKKHSTSKGGYTVDLFSVCVCVCEREGRITIPIGLMDAPAEKDVAAYSAWKMKQWLLGDESMLPVTFALFILIYPPPSRP